MISLLSVTGCTTTQDKRTFNSQTFGWPFLDPETMQTRGGTSQGSPVTLNTAPSSEWQALKEEGLTAFQKDRTAILAMQGSYRASFEFTESAGFSDDYTPSRPYFSWGTEVVNVIEDREDFISLQHIMVMYFVNEQGETEGPMVMKHWRQDWQYEDNDLHVYTGSRDWKREKVKNTKGRWTQIVYQVDDSPRYQVTGSWQHGKNYSSWRSDSFMRPLPRREYSVRDDYNMLKGMHTITITPNSWVHQQDNLKINRQDGTDTHIAAETGINRYERISEPELQTAASEYWTKTGTYWKAVRDTWQEILKEKDSFGLKRRHEGTLLFMYHFGYAAEITDETSEDAQKKHARDTIMDFLRDAGTAEKTGY